MVILFAATTVTQISGLQASVGHNETGTMAAMTDSTDNLKEGFINMGSLHSFTKDLSAHQKNDVLTSTLYAQIKASEKYDRTGQPYQWYTEYVTVLSQHGWDIKPFSFNTFSPSSATFAIAEALKPILSPHCTSLQSEVCDHY